MIERSIMIHNRVEAQDPGEAVRKAMGTARDSARDSSGFARALGEQASFSSPDARLPQAGALVTPAALGASGLFGKTLGEKAASDPVLAAALARSGAGMPESLPAPSVEQPVEPSARNAGAPESEGIMGIPLKRGGRISLEGTALPLTGRGESAGISLSVASSGVLLRRGLGGIALDERSLRTLSRVREKSSEEKRTFVEGGLSAQFESGGAGVGAVGYDRMGGTSYGLYQISSRQGTFKEFLKYLDQEDPSLAERLRAAGNPDTGGRAGSVPEAWKSIAAEDAERFTALQHDFIRKTHFEPVLKDVEKTLGVGKLSEAVKEVVWSTAVQHGPNGARRLFAQAAEHAAGQTGNSDGKLDERSLIRDVYALRKEQFGSSDGPVRDAVRRRLEKESELALAMIGKSRLA